MLADFLSGHRQELVRQAERRAAEEEGPEPATGREARITALVTELITALERGKIAPTRAVGAEGKEAALMCHERDLVREEALARIRHDLPAVTLGEMSIVFDWPNEADRGRLREQGQRLSELLDDMSELAIVLSPEARVEYVNRAAATRREVSGSPYHQLLGKTLHELGVPQASDVCGNRRPSWRWAAGWRSPASSSCPS
jgi:hypothetical protein